MKINRYTWILLIMLTIVSYFFSKSQVSTISILSLMAILILKCTLVGFQFMELRKAHLFWKVAMLSLIGLFTMIVAIVTIV